MIHAVTGATAHIMHATAIGEAASAFEDACGLRVELMGAIVCAIKMNAL